MSNFESKFRLEIVVIAIFVAFNIWHISLRGIWNPISVIDTLHLSPEVAKAARSLDNNIQSSSKPYDGQYSYVIALDPLLNKKTWVPLLDQPIYRYRRIFYPLLSRILSLNQIKSLPYALLLVNLASFIAGLFIVRKLAQKNKWSSWVGLAFAANTGLIYCVFGSMGEPLGLALGLGGIYSFLEKRLVLSYSLFSLAILTRETYVLIPIAVLSWAVMYENMKIRSALGALVMIVMPSMCWNVFILLRFQNYVIPPYVDQWPASLGRGRFSLPFVAFWQETFFGIMHLTTRMELKRTVSISVVATFACLFSFFYYKKKPSLWGLLALSQALFVSMIRGDIWNYHASSSRQVIPLFLFIYIWMFDELSKVKCSRSFPRQLG